MRRMHLRPEIALEPWLMEAAQTIFERLQPYVKQDHADELFTHTSRAIRTALAPYLYSKDMCTLTATSREGERPSIGPTAVEPCAEHNPLYLKADGDFEDLLEALAVSIWANLRDHVADHQGGRAYMALSQALRSLLERSLIAYETCGLSPYCTEGEVRVLPEAASR
jgi:hypothetical protein